MKLVLLKYLCLCLIFFEAGQVAATETYRSEAVCENHLNLELSSFPEDHRAGVSAKFARGLDDAIRSSGYIGVSQKTLRELLETGSAAFHTRLHRASSTEMRMKTNHEQPAQDRAAADALALTQLSVIKGRLQNRRLQMDDQSMKWIFQLLHELNRQFDFEGVERPSPVSLLDLLPAVRRISRFSTDVPRDPEQQLSFFAHHLGIPKKTIHSPGHADEQGLDWLFSDLPLKAGYIFVMRTIPHSKRRGDVRIVWLNQIYGIEPLGTGEFLFLDKLSNQANGVMDRRLKRE